MAPAKAVGSPRPARARATFQVEPPTRLTHCSPPWWIMSVSASPAHSISGPSCMAGLLQGRHDVVAGAHGVVIDLAGRAFLVAELAVLVVEDAVPGAVLVVDQVGPAVFPQA